MDFEAFFNFHLKWLRFIGFRLKFGGYKVPKMFDNFFYFYFIQFSTATIIIAFKVMYMIASSSTENILMETCNLIYVLEVYIKSFEIHRNTDKLVQMLHNLASLHEDHCKKI